MSPGGVRQQRFAVQDRVFAALERLECKETQHAAYEELQRLIRVHVLRLAAMCTDQGRCLAWRAMLAPPLLLKLLALLSRALRDSESAVRTAGAEAFGTVAAQLLVAHPGGCQLTAGDPANPVLACILEALGEPGTAVQSAAATALAAVADHLCPGMEPGLLCQLLRLLGNPLFLGRAELCSAVARLEDGCVRGLVASSCQQLLAALPELMGSTADGTGLLSALTSKGKDFQLRASAAHTLKALAVGLGPLCTSGWEAAVAALRTAKTDISKPVRDAALAALPVVAGLQDFLATGAHAAAWPQVCGSLLAAAKGARGRRLPGVAGKGKAAAAQGVPGHSNPCVGAQQIPAVWPQSGAVDASGVAGCAPSIPTPGPRLACHAPTTSAAVAQVPAAGPWGHPSASSAPPFALAPSTATSAGVAAPTEAPSDHLAAQLASIQVQQAQMAAALSSFTAATHGTLCQMQRHLASVSAGVAALALGSGAGGGVQQGQQQAELQDRLAAMHAGMAALEVGVTSVQQQQQQQHVAASGAGQAAPAGLPAAGGATPKQGPPAEPKPAVMAAPHCQPKRLSSLHRSYDVLEQQLHTRPARRQQASSQQPHDQASHRGGEGNTASAPSTSTSASPGSPQASPDAVYTQLLGGGSGGLSGDQQALRLLRAMARSGPVWEQLSSSTAQRLVHAITGLLQEGIALKRLLPWLWPLADTSSPAATTAASFPHDTRQQLLAALAAYPLPTCAEPDVGAGQAEGKAIDDAVSGAITAPTGSADAPLAGQAEKRQLLLSALRAVWDA